MKTTVYIDGKRHCYHEELYFQKGWIIFSSRLPHMEIQLQICICAKLLENCFLTVSTQIVVL